MCIKLYNLAVDTDVPGRTQTADPDIDHSGCRMEFQIGYLLMENYLQYSN